MELIDAGAIRFIDADALADALFEQRKNYPQWVADTIGNMPEAIVRCMDCKHGQLINGAIWCLTYVPHKLVPQDWFCADGERRRDDG